MLSEYISSIPLPTGVMMHNILNVFILILVAIGPNLHIIGRQQWQGCLEPESFQEAFKLAGV